MEFVVVQPEEELSIHSGSVTLKKAADQSVSHDVKELAKISILAADDEGPQHEDVFFTFYFNNAIIMLPHTNKCADAVYNTITELFHIDYSKIIKAVSRKESAEFVLWTKTS